MKVWRKMERIEHPMANTHWREVKQRFKLDKANSQKYLEGIKYEEVYQNDQYMAFVNRRVGPGAFPYSTAVTGGGLPLEEEFVWLSFKRNDRKPVKDWRHVQNIKNDILGPECEMVELFPAESRLVDTANQYHLWGFTNSEIRWPFGFAVGIQESDVQGIKGAVQREIGALD